MKTTAVYGALTKVEDNDDGTITVTGIASTGNPDNEGETVTPAAMEAALPDYMLFGAVREMHQATTAAGTALSAKIDDEGVTHFSALVVDDDAIKKVKTGVYKGFSIGGKVLDRDPMDKTVITAIKLTEISLVDRPCNPEAVINMWKVDMDGKTAAGAPATQAEGAAVDALADLINKGEVSVDELLSLAKAAKAKKAEGANADGAGTIPVNQGGNDPADQDGKKGTPDEAAKAAKDEGDEDEFNKKDYSDDDRKAMADSGEAMPDGSFPIKTKKDLSNAVKAYGRAKDKEAAKKHIKSRAKSLGAEDALPEKWDSDDAAKAQAIANLAKADGDTSVQNTGVAAIPNADTPMLPKPQVGQLAQFKWGDASIQGKIKEIGDGSMSVAPDNGADNSEFMVNVKTAGLVYGDVGGGVNAWHEDPATKEVAVSKSQVSDDLKKGMWTVSDFARLLQEVVYLQSSMQWETDSEKDGSTIAKQLAAWAKQGGQLLLSYVQEEVGELFEGMADPDDVGEVVIALAAQSNALHKCDADRVSYSGDRLAKASESTLAKVGKRNSAADMAHIQGSHDAMCKLGAKCSSDNCEKDDGGDDDDMAMALKTGDLAKAMKLAKHEGLASTEALVKAAVDGVSLKFATALKKAEGTIATLSTELDELKKTARPVAGHTGAGASVTISKSQDNGTSTEAPVHQPALGPDGKPDEALTAIRKSQQGGSINTITLHGNTGPASRGLS